METAEALKVAGPLAGVLALVLAALVGLQRAGIIGRIQN